MNQEKPLLFLRYPYRKPTQVDEERILRPAEEALTPVDAEPLLGYHPCSIGFLTSSRDPAGGQCQVGSLTGAVASERVSEALKGSLRMVGNHSKSANGIRLREKDLCWFSTAR